MIFSRKNCFFTIFILNIFLYSDVAMANVIWPSFYIAEGLSSIYIILAGFAVEFLCIKFLAKQKWFKALLISAVMNGMSAVVGVVLVPLGGAYLSYPFVIFSFLSDEIFEVLIWIVPYIFAVFCNVLVEGVVIHFIFHMKFEKSLKWLIPANLFSVAMCFVNIFYKF